MSPIRILLVEDHAVVRAGLRMLLGSDPDMVIVGEAENGRQGVALAQELRPDVVLMDISMPDLNGIEATRQIKKACPEVAVLALTMHEDDQYFFAMLGAGASGYVPKRAAANDLIAAIRAVHAGGMFLFPSVARLLVEDYLSKRESTEAQRLDVLTEREREVLTLIAEGKSNQEIADALVISVKTVNRHRENIMAKLNLHSRVELVRYAIEKGLIEL
ncbi:MAG: response regulator transcription factor [Anaerolineae bacterium]|nr:response regulator transcription factor [Anaerolineae bacterium]